MEYVPIWLREEREVGIKIGEEKGKQEGMEEKAIETAKRMLEKGFEIDIIMEITGLKKEEVETLAAMVH
jgi:predicted transposase/invertase (TIGR01784 family)